MPHPSWKPCREPLHTDVSVNFATDLAEHVKEFSSDESMEDGCGQRTADMDILLSWLEEELQGRMRSIDKRLEDLKKLMVAQLEKSDRILANRVVRARRSMMPQKSDYFSPLSQAKEKSEKSSSNANPFRLDGSSESQDGVVRQHTIGSERFVQHLVSVSASAKGRRVGQRTLETLRLGKDTAVLQDIIHAHQTRRGLLAAKIWRFMENPYSGLGARLFSIFFQLIVAASVCVSIWQTVDGYPLGHPDAVQAVFESIFAVDLFVRFIVCPDRCYFLHDVFNYLDLMSVMPLVLRIVVAVFPADESAEHELSKLVFLPVLRLLKLTRRFEKLRLLLSAFLLAVEALPVLLYTLSIIALSFAAAVYRVEPDDNIESLPRALWYVLVTLTTVGFGDVTPTTTAGHLITGALILIGVLYMAIPIGIVGHTFSHVWGERDKLLLMQRMRVAFLQQGFSARSLHSIVTLFDQNQDGVLHFHEFKKMLQLMHINISEDRMLWLMEELDEDGSGSINAEEIIRTLFPRSAEEFISGFLRASDAGTVSSVEESVEYCEGRPRAETDGVRSVYTDYTAYTRPTTVTALTAKSYMTVSTNR